MSPEMKEATQVEEEKRQRFRDRYGSLRLRMLDLAEEQRQLRLQRKPSRGRINKCPRKALEITVILNLMLEMRGKDTVRTVELRCRDRLCNAHRNPLIGQKRVFVHAYPTEGYWMEKAKEIRKEILLSLELDEFLEHCERTLK